MPSPRSKPSRCLGQVLQEVDQEAERALGGVAKTGAAVPESISRALAREPTSERFRNQPLIRSGQGRGLFRRGTRKVFCAYAKS